MTWDDIICLWVGRAVMCLCTGVGLTWLLDWCIFYLIKEICGLATFGDFVCARVKEHAWYVRLNRLFRR